MSDLVVLYSWTFGGKDYQLCQERGVAFVRNRNVPTEHDPEPEWWSAGESPELLVVLVELANKVRLGQGGTS